MARKLLAVNFFNGGIAEAEKEGLRGSFLSARNLDIFSEPANLTLLLKTAKESGTTVVDLPKWCVSGAPHDTNTYFIGDTGKFYKRTSAGAWSVEQTTANCKGQGMDVFNDYVYYTQNTQLGRYGALSGSPSFDDSYKTGLTDTSGSTFAPVKQFKDGLAVGHGNKVGWLSGTADPLTWDDDKLVLPVGFNVRALEVIDNFLAIGCWVGTSVTDSERGLVFFWDGITSTYSDYVELTEGGIQALLNSRNRLLTVAGADGNLYRNYTPFQKVDTIPNVGISKYVDVYPGAVTNWKGLAHIGVAGATDSTTLIQGVYQYGAKSAAYREVLTDGYTISTGSTTGTTLKIGCVKGIGSTMFIGWRDGSSYGVDKVVRGANYFANGTYEALIFDDRRPLQDKQALTLIALHKALASGESVQLGHKINRAASYTTGTANSTAGETITRMPLGIGATRFKEFQFECILGGGSTSPTILALGLEYNDLAEELLI